MSKAEKHIGFLPDGCLSEGMMLSYLEDNLSDKERNQAERHMQSCDLCVDALEGMSMFPSQQRVDAISETKTQVKRRFLSQENYGRYLSIAASVGIIGFSFFFLYSFLFNGVNKESAQTTLPPAENTAVLPKIQPAETVAEEKSMTDSVTEPIAIVSPAKEKVFINPSIQSDAIILKENTVLSKIESNSSRSANNLNNGNEFAPQSSELDDISESQLNNDKIVSNNTKNISNSTNDIVIPIAKKGESENKSERKETAQYFKDNEEEKPNQLKKKYKSSIQRSPSREAEPKTTSADNLEYQTSMTINDVKNKYATQDYQSTLNLISAYKNAHGETEATLYYGGMSYFHLQKYDLALASLEKISPPYADYNEAQLTIAKCHLANGNVEKAKLILEEIKMGNSKFSKEAEEELLKLNQKN